MIVEEAVGGDVGESKTAGSAKLCKVCGQKREQLYQDDTCKPCLVKNFSRHISIINEFRNREG